MNVLEDWTAACCRELGLDPAMVERDAVLDLARDVAHSVARPAAPLTAYLLGLAVGQGMDAGEAWRRVTAAAREWEGSRGAEPS